MQCERDTLISLTPARVAASRIAPDKRTDGAPCGSLTISMDRQGSGPFHATGSALRTASLAAHLAAKCWGGIALREQYSISPAVNHRSRNAAPRSRIRAVIRLTSTMSVPTPPVTDDR